MKVLNLYCGIGGNRKLWPEECRVTAVELNPEIAKIYQDFFPNDKVIVGDAHQYLLDHYKEFAFIWSSPPCPTHSRMVNSLKTRVKMKYPDMKLYQEIIFLKQFFKGSYVVENVISYYEPLIKPQISGRHYFWSDFHILNMKIVSDFDYLNCHGGKIPPKEYTQMMKKYLDIDCNNIQYMRNCVHPKLGLHIFNCAFKEKQETLVGKTDEL